jgi:hypothetical protein
VRLVRINLRSQLVLPSMIPNGQWIVPFERVPGLLNMFAGLCLPAPKRLVTDAKLFLNLRVRDAHIGLRATIGF